MLTKISAEELLKSVKKRPVFQKKQPQKSTENYINKHQLKPK